MMLTANLFVILSSIAVSFALSYSFAVECQTSIKIVSSCIDAREQWIEFWSKWMSAEWINEWMN